MKSTFKRSISLFLSLALAFSLMTVGASAEEFTDMPNGWSREAVASAVENGLLRGSDGRLDPTGLLTRAQLATVIVRAFGADPEADLSGFTDVKADSWYYSALAKAKGMAVMNGTSDSTMSPDRPISRQEVFVLLARALKLADGKAEALNAYKDVESVGAWAVGGTAAMVSAGYVNGSDGYLLPTDSITREQFAQILYNIFGNYYQAAGVYTDDVNGSLLVNIPDVIIRNAKITGDLVIGDGVGEGDLTLENVSIGGRLVVRGGGVNSIHIKGSAISSVVIGKENGAVRVVADSSSHVEYINIADGKDDVIIEGKVNTIAVENEAVPVVLKNATVETLQVNGDNAEISLVGSTKVSTLDVAEDTKGVKLDKEETTTVGTLNTESNITITGEGEISNITGSGKPTDEKGDEVKPTTKPTGSSGGGGGHSHSYASEWTTNDTHHWHAATCSHTDLKDGYAGHTYTITRDTATCTVAGEKTETCVCGVSRTVASPAKNHDFTGAYLHDAAGHWHKCTRCVETDIKNEHTWNAGEITTPVGCTEAGVKTYTCTVCGETKTEPVSPNGHSFAEAWSKDENTHWHASTCGHDVKDGEASHTWNAGEITTEPTETTDGVKTYTCTACGATKTETVSTTGGVAIPDVSGFAFSKDESGRCIITLNVDDDEIDTSGFTSYSIDCHLSKDNGDTWTVYVGRLYPDDNWAGNFCFDELDAGTYTKIKVVSHVIANSKMYTAEKTFDCTVNVSVEQSNAVSTLTGNDGSYTAEITGLNSGARGEGFYQIWFSSDASFSNWFRARGGGTTNANGTETKSVPDNRITSESYYCITEYKYNDLTVGTSTVSVSFKRSNWTKCEIGS